MHQPLRRSLSFAGGRWGFTVLVIILSWISLPIGALKALSNLDQSPTTQAKSDAFETIQAKEAAVKTRLTQTRSKLSALSRAESSLPPNVADEVTLCLEQRSGCPNDRFPTQYDSSGVMTFVIHQSKIYQKSPDGPRWPKMAEILSKMKEYNPDLSWELFHHRSKLSFLTKVLKVVPGDVKA